MSKTNNNIKLKATKLVHMLMDNGGDLLYKAKQRGVDLSIEREMSKD